MNRVLPFALVFSAAPLVAQPVRTLAKPVVELEEPFSQISGVRELRDGRLVVADTRDKTLQAVDLKTGRMTPIGREGSGPNEWGMAMRVIGYPGDSVLVADPINSRFLLLGPDGRAVRTFSPVADQAVAAATGGAGGQRVVTAPPAGARGGAAAGQVFALGGGAMSMLSTRAVDRQGKMYVTGSPITMGPSGPKGADSIPILRQDVKTNKADTMAWLHQPKDNAEVRQSGSGNSQQIAIRIGSNVPFTNGDEWAVFPEGRIAIARAVDYRVDIVMPDKRVIRGAPVRYTPVKVAEADKAQWRESRRSMQSVAISNNNGNRSVSTSSPAQLGADEPATWPATKSPFATSQVFAAPNGETWVVRQRSATDQVPSADVFDAQGKLIATVKMPPKTRVLALGAKGVYLARNDDDDLQYIQHHVVKW
jgi:hypothetical protein